MRRALSDDEFFAAPWGQYLQDGNLAYWCLDERLWGVTIVGHGDEHTARQLMRWIDREFESSYPPYASLLDFRDVISISAGAFAEFGAFAYRNRARQARHVSRGAIVRPPNGLFAAAIAGAIPVFRLIVSWDTYDTMPAALTSLGLADPRGEIDELRARLDVTHGELEAVRAIIAAERGAPDRIARRLGLSVRSLQRRLRSQGTTLELELRRARIAEAKRLLAETDLKLAAIASETGFPTHAYFTRVFRDEVGSTPSEWRERVRGSGAGAREV